MASIRFDCLPYSPLRITSPYGPRNTGIKGASTNHLGVDMGTDKSKYKGSTDGGPIKAVLPYAVASSYYNKYRGWVVLLDHGNGVQTLYQHLKEKGAAKGVKGKSGNTIGTMGNTGTGAQLHLHFELRVNGTPVDPEPYLKAIEKGGKEVTYKEALDVLVREKVISSPDYWEECGRTTFHIKELIVSMAEVLVKK